MQTTKSSEDLEDPTARGTTMSDMPKKIILQILSNIPADQLQSLRSVCSRWNEVVSTEYGITIIVQNANYEAMFDCQSATKVVFDNFTTPITKEIQFSGSLSEVEFKGEIGRQNIVEIFKHCSNIESIQFANVFFVDIYTRISCPPDIVLPKFHHFKIVVNFFQDCLSSSELILIDFLNKIETDSIKSISILSDEPVSNLTFRIANAFDEEDIFHIAPDFIQDVPINPAPLAPNPAPNPAPHVPTGFATEREIRTPGGTIHQTFETVFPGDDINNGFMSMAIFMWAEQDNNIIPLAVNDEAENTIPDREFPIAPDIFTEFLLKNHTSIQTLTTNFSEFKCLGDISHWEEDVLKQIQFETLSYSFGETREENEEYKLLRNQHSLRSLNLFTIRGAGGEEQFWEDVCQAISSSETTLEEVEFTIFAEDDWMVDLAFLAGCNQLKNLTFKHYSRKHGFDRLPKSIEVLKLTGLIFGNELQSIAHRLVNLTWFELQLNTEGDQLDLDFFTQLLRSPKLQKITLRACNVSREAMEFLLTTEGLKVEHEHLFPIETCFSVSVQPNFQRDAFYL